MQIYVMFYYQMEVTTQIQIIENQQVSLTLPLLPGNQNCKSLFNNFYKQKLF